MEKEVLLEEEDGIDWEELGSILSGIPDPVIKSTISSGKKRKTYSGIETSNFNII